MTAQTKAGPLSSSDATSECHGFQVSALPESRRLLQVRFDETVVKAFLEATAEMPLQALEYKSFLRFRVAGILDDLCHNTLRPFLAATLTDRETGAMRVQPAGLEAVGDAEAMVKFSTAVAHLIGRSNYDAMSGQYYARFVVENVDNSDSYLRKPHRVMELHTDGTFVEQETDYVLMMKLAERNMAGGNSLLLHLDNWEDCERFARDPMAGRTMRWTAPPSKNVAQDIYHPVFRFDQDDRPVISYIDQFVQPKNFEEGNWLADLSDSLESSANRLSIPVPTGQFLLINNHFWLHGRDRFTPNPELHRELMRQRGYFAPAESPYQAVRS